MLMTAGERISMSLLAIALNAVGCPAVSFTGSQVGIITDTRHTAARILEVRPHRVRRELERGAVVVVGGFQGVSTAKEVTTLGRGGSDTTAVALAAALGAERCEILTDVEAVYTADPRCVPDARPVAEMSYEDMAELARFGATVLKEDAIRFAERNGIELAVGASDADAPGTIVVERPECRDDVKAVSLLRNASLIASGERPLVELVDELNASGGEPIAFFASGSGVAVATEGPGPEVRGASSRKIQLLCVTGCGAGSPETLVTTSRSLDRAGAEVLAVAGSARSLRIALSTERPDDVLRAVHTALVPQDPGEPLSSRGSG
jgi:uridylate kinase